jgi:ribosome-binding ATPase YchF (GTP1/OBG family)
MTKLVSALCLVGIFSIVGCGGDDDKKGEVNTSDPVAACKAVSAELCSKIFSCLDQAVLDQIAEFVGNNESDCNTKINNENCSAQDVKCDSGTTYDSSAAGECLNQVKALSCKEFESDLTATPAACDDDAICH